MGKRYFRATVKARHVCSPDCDGRIFEGFGKTPLAARRDARRKCEAAGCHTPGGEPWNCDCGHNFAKLIHD
jgi:hypothetical protein